MKDKLYLYAARDTVTRQLVSDITNPKRKYWDKKGNAVKAIDAYNRNYAGKVFPVYTFNRGMHNTIELVTFELVEVKDESNN